MTNQTPSDPQKGPARTKPGNEEPELVNEESVPLDGPDPEGERMMDDLGRERAARGDKVPEQPPAEPLPGQLPTS